MVNKLKYMSLKAKLDRRLNQLRSSSFNGFPQIIKDFFEFFDEQPFLKKIGNRLRTQYPNTGSKVSMLLQSQVLIENISFEASVAVTYEILRRISYQHLDIGNLRGILGNSIYPRKLNIFDYPKNSQIQMDEHSLLIFKEIYLEKFITYIEEQVEEYEMKNKAKENLEAQDKLTVNQTFHAPVGAVQNASNSIANINQNIGQNFSEILEQLAHLKREFQSLPDEDREEAIEVVDALAVEVQSETPSKGKVKAFLSSVKDFAVKTGSDVTSKIVVELIKGQVGI